MRKEGRNYRIYGTPEVLNSIEEFLKYIECLNKDGDVNDKIEIMSLSIDKIIDPITKEFSIEAGTELLNKENKEYNLEQKQLSIMPNITALIEKK